MNTSNRFQLSRRSFLKTASVAAGGLCLTGCLEEARRSHSFRPPAVTNRGASAVAVNDIHSQLNAALVQEVVRPASVDQCQDAVRKARKLGRAVSVAGGRHSMGGQQFADESVLI